MLVPASRLKLLKKAAVLSAVRHKPGVSRRELAHLLESTDSNLSRITRELIADGFLMESTTLPKAVRGRPNVGLYLNEKNIFLLCVVLSKYEQRISLINLSGQRVTEDVVSGRLDDLSANVLSQCIQIKDRVASQPNFGFRKLCGIKLVASRDLQIPGEADTGIWLSALANKLETNFQAPVSKSAIADALHIAEMRQDVVIPRLPSIMVHAGFSIDVSLIVIAENSSRIMFEGRLDPVRTIYDSASSSWKPLDTVASAGAILKRLGHLDQIDASGLDGLRLGVPHAIRQANARDRRAILVFRDAGEAVGAAIAGLLAILSPAQVIIAGPLAAAAPFMEGIISVLPEGEDSDRRSIAVDVSKLSDLGAAELAGLEALVFSSSLL
jgi:hypothetical protein